MLWITAPGRIYCNEILYVLRFIKLLNLCGNHALFAIEKEINLGDDGKSYGDNATCCNKENIAIEVVMNERICYIVLRRI